LSSVGKQSSLTMMKRNRKRERTKRTGSKEDTSRTECTIQVVVEARQHQNGSERGSRCCVHKDLTVTTKQIQALLTAARASGGKDECQVRLTGIEREYWMGTEISRLGGYGFLGTVTAGDGSNQKGGKMGAGYVNLRKKKGSRGRWDAKRKDPARTVRN